MKYLIAVCAVILLCWFAVGLLTPDKYIGFFYPDASNLTYDIMSDEVFTELWECRTWAEKMAIQHADEVFTHDNGYDYECGKNCKITGGKPYVCEETLR